MYSMATGVATKTLRGAWQAVCASSVLFKDLSLTYISDGPRRDQGFVQDNTAVVSPPHRPPAAPFGRAGESPADGVAVNDHTRIAALTLSIAAVERDTGLSKDTLRVWERRYGFPTPGRDTVGERIYTLDQVEKLRLIKRLMDAGHRPGRIVPLPFAELLLLSASSADPPGRHAAATPEPAASADLRAHIELIRAHDMRSLRIELTRQLSRYGVARFIVDVVGPLNTAVGDAWIRGQIEIFEEHMFTETMQVVLRQTIAGIPEPLASQRPRVLLTTFPGEPHGLGLLMAEAMFVLEGCPCISLGTQTPLWDVVLAVAAHRADIVALSFTGCMNPNQVVDSLAELRQKLPPAVKIWAGGSAPVLHRRRVAGVEPMASFEGLPSELRRWRSAAGAQVSG
jgi:MerR family transcriptional regulator, light-induced transcriptional regulator